MRCPSCHHDNRSDRRFCTQCGTNLAVGCPSCGAPIEVAEKFWGGCGAEIRVLAARGKTDALTPNTLTANTLRPSPRSYTPRNLAEKILTSRTSLEGERKQVTVLFVDVKGSMELEE